MYIGSVKFHTKAAHTRSGQASLAYQSPEVGKLLDEVSRWDRTEAVVVGRGDSGHAQRPHTSLKKLPYDKTVIAAANLQEGDGEAVDVHLRIVGLARQNLGGGVDLCDGLKQTSAGSEAE